MAAGEGSDAPGPRHYRCAEGVLFLKRSAEPQAAKITQITKTVGADVFTTGRLWVGPSGGVWAELDASLGEIGWALVQGPGFGIAGPVLVDAANPGASHSDVEASTIWPTKPRSDEEWRLVLSPRRYEVLREKETEPKFSGEYNKFFPSTGHFKCAGCGAALYSASAKYDGRCGWPSFSRCYKNEFGLASVVGQVDWKTNGREILCRCCGGHLGHVFMDGRHTGGDTEERHCTNSLSVIYDERLPSFLKPGSVYPDSEVLCDLRTFDRHLKQHFADGSYPTVVGYPEP